MIQLIAKGRLTDGVYMGNGYLGWIFRDPLLSGQNYPTRTAPPFTLNTSPVMNPACGVHRNRMGAAISSGVATLPSGMVLRIRPRVLASLRASADMSVFTHPGATQLT